MNNDNIISTILEKIDYTIDEDVKKLLQSQKVRQEMLKKYGEKAFLDPKELKFPVINPKTGKFDCKLIHAAIVRSAVYAAKGSSKKPNEYYANIKVKADALYKSEKCSDKLKAKVSTESNEEVDVLILNDIFSITEAEYDSIINRTNYIE
jgi:hypothetical protein